MKKHINKLKKIILLLLSIPLLSACTEDRKTADTSRNNDSVANQMSSLNIQYQTQPTIAPDFELNSVTGRKVSLREYRGKVVLLSFWATW